MSNYWRAAEAASIQLSPRYCTCVAERIPVNEAITRPWVEVAQGARLSARMLSRMGDPAADSNFAQINALYPWEKASDWCRSYLSAALEHLSLWADYAAPLKFHPEHEVVHTFRPAYTLARAALEASSQAVWLTAGTSARECALRHLSLIRWDYQEHRKSVASTEGKQAIDAMDATLLERMSGVLAPEDLYRPNHFTVLRDASSVIERDPADVERIWRAASGSAHGRVWPSLTLQHVVPLAEYEPGHFRTVRVPDADGMTEVLTLAQQMTLHGVLRYADYAGEDIPELMEEARLWLASVIPFREDADVEVVEHLKRPRL
jgi:hypothetical protein